MDKEVSVLNYLSKNDEATQRDISNSTGLSLGSVNLLLKKMISKGLVKIEHLTPRTVRYILTPTGIKEKTERTYNYIVRTYNEILRIRRLIVEVLAEQVTQDKDIIYFYGRKDEVAEIIKSIVAEEHLRNKCRVVHRVEEIGQENDKESVVIVWSREAEKKVGKELGQREVVNVMGKLEIW